jgi:hypothetical protein
MQPHEQMTPKKVIDIIKLGGSPPEDPHLYTDMQLWLLVRQYSRAKSSMLEATKAILDKVHQDDLPSTLPASR